MIYALWILIGCGYASQWAGTDIAKRKEGFWFVLPLIMYVLLWPIALGEILHVIVVKETKK